MKVGMNSRRGQVDETQDTLQYTNWQLPPSIKHAFYTLVMLPSPDAEGCRLPHEALESLSRGWSGGATNSYPQSPSRDSTIHFHQALEYSTYLDHVRRPLSTAPSSQTNDDTKLQGSSSLVLPSLTQYHSVAINLESLTVVEAGISRFTSKAAVFLGETAWNLHSLTCLGCTLVVPQLSMPIPSAASRN